MVTNKQNVLVIIPAYNEEKTIGTVIEKVQHSVPAADIVVVDDGSVDGTARVVRKTGAKLISRELFSGWEMMLESIKVLIR